METTIQAKPFVTKEDFFKYRAAFKELAHHKALSGHDMAMHNILRNRKPDLGFTPITKKSKIANGHRSAFSEIYSNIWRGMRRWKQTGNLSYVPYIPYVSLTSEGLQHIYDCLDMWNASEASKA